ncbi:MAG: DNA methyltransferase, partial [Candidatus Bathyarchaeia archaeon]
MTDRTEFRSKVEDYVDGKVVELKFPSSAGFRPFQFFFSEESIAHPAKASLYLLRYLIKKYTKEGEVVADIMAGTGSTGIVASYMGRHSVLVELEEKFVDWINKNVQLLEKRKGKRGEVKVIQGDARKLTQLLGVNADSIVTSPPYSSGGWKADEDPSNPIHREEERRKLYPMRPPNPGRYSENRDNIGNLP